MEAAELVGFGSPIQRALQPGEEIAKQCLDKGITMVVFDRGGFRYEGRVKEGIVASSETVLVSFSHNTKSLIRV